MRKKAGRELYERACNGGDDLGCGLLGSALLASGSETARALPLLQRACGAAVAEGCAGLARALEQGRGIAADAERAAKLYAEACSEDHAESCRSLALMYVQGRGVKEDAAQGRTFLQRACELGSDAACREARNIE
jgi:TPR repeat protein